MPIAISVDGSMAWSIERLSAYPLTDRNTTSTAADRTRARPRISETGTPIHFAVDIRWPPTLLLMHSSVW